MYNPFNGVRPSLGPFAQYLQNPISIGIGLVWAAVLIYCAIHLLTATTSLIRARRSGRPMQAEEASKDMLFPAVALLIAVLVPVLYTVIVNMANR